MAGTLFGLPLSQPVDLDGKPQVGCKLYVYAAGSFTTPVTAYKDFGLTAGQEHPFPIPSDAWGRLPIFWLADGSYAFRLVDADGIPLASALTVQALGPSAGGGGGGTPVDENALIKTGDVWWQEVQGTRAGFVRDNGRTIGSATSGATERANADCAALYTFIWTNFNDTTCPVTGGRGASAAADFSANKPIQLPDKRGMVLGGLADMGNSDSGRLNGIPVVSGSITTAGSVIGENLHYLSLSELPQHNHGVNETPHSHDVHFNATGYASGFVSGVSSIVTPPGTTFGASAAAARSTGISIQSNGGNGPHNTAQMTVLGTVFRKL